MSKKKYISEESTEARHSRRSQAEVEKITNLFLYEVMDGKRTCYSLFKYIQKQKRKADAGEPHDEEYVWDIKIDMCYYYWNKAIERWQEINKQDATKHRNKIIMNLQSLYLRARKEGKLNVARLVMKDLSRITGAEEVIPDSGGGEEKKSSFKLPDGTVIDI